jgi:hypothetical protein
MLMCEAMAPGSYPELVGTRAAPTTGEGDPCIVAAKYTGDGDNFQWGTTADHLAASTITTAPFKGYYCHNGTNGQAEAFVNFIFCANQTNVSSDFLGFPASYNSAISSGDGVGVNPLDDKDWAMPILVCRTIIRSTQLGPKGFTSHLRWPGINRAYPSAIDIGAERYVYVGDLLIPFENGTIPLT